ncbi:flavodoxin domain-containing protein [Acidithiobacillus sp. IBUN Pt1247-S3]|uniref:flavodoxin domain-containing protein n=1 Tax=Acidithiobacillus sp. IBUN Pt1247-S3 TaxID=3166642 RepID=UPI0034E4877D
MSGFPEVLNNLTPELAHAWHPVALADEVSERPLQVRLLGESWVLVRIADSLMALRDQCPHRSAPLSAGCVVDGALECPYHGWRFAAGGHCVHIPAMGAQTPPRSTAAHAPAGLEERYGLIWLAPKYPSVPLIDIPEWNNAEFHTGIMPPLRTRASAAQIVDNFLDVTHFYYLHGKSFGLTSPDPIRLYHVDRSANEVVLHHQTFFSNGSGPLLTRLGHYHCTLPYQCRLLAEFPGSDRRDMIALIAQPEDAESTRIYKLLAYNWGDAATVEEMLAFETQVIQEDVAMTERLPTPDVPLANGAQAHARGDEIGLAWRQAMRQAFRQDSNPLPVTDIAKPHTAEEKAIPITLSEMPAATVLLWASQTGTAQGLAENLAKQLRRKNIAADCLAMEEISPQELQRYKRALFVTSTFGDGDAPDNGSEFWEAINQAEMPRLESLRYAVLGLGDRSFDSFCAHGRRLNQRLRELGASALLPFLEAESADSDDITSWQSKVLELYPLMTANPLPAPALTATSGNRSSAASFSHTRLLGSRRLGHAQHERFLTHCAVDIGETGLQYETGDLLLVLPENPPREVDALLQASGFAGNESIQVGEASMTLRAALSGHLDIRRWGTKALQEKQSGESPQDFAKRLRPLQARRYSIASSASAKPEEVHLLVTGQHQDGGLCSSYLASLDHGAKVRANIQANPKFRLPAADLPIIMIGAGSGLAPFLGFLQERETRGDPGKNWLFFGERHAASDFHFAEEIQRWQQSGHLSRLDTAFSRDQSTPIYVQHRIQENAAMFWDWIQKGAFLYLCGSLQRLAKGVGETLQQVAEEQGGLSPEDARAYWVELQRAGRFCKDIY